MAFWQKKRSAIPNASATGATDVERSGSNAPIYRHESVARPFRVAAETDSDLREGIEAHLCTFLGESPMVWHEIVSDLVHVDVFAWVPTDERPWHTFVTVGMSDLPMTVPPDAIAEGVARRAELMVCLQASWPVPETGATIAPWPDESYFPIRWLKTLARLPHEYQTWLGFGHTVPNGDPPAPITSGTSLCGWLLLPPMTMPQAFRRLEVGGERVDFFGIIAVYRDELDHKLAHGVESLFAGFDRDGVSELLDLTRASTVR
jgi:suppressor of fused protein SUFU